MYHQNNQTIEKATFSTIRPETKINHVQSLPNSVTVLLMISLTLGVVITIGYVTTLAIRARYQGKIEMLLGHDIRLNIEGKPQENEQSVNTNLKT